MTSERRWGALIRTVWQMRVVSGTREFEVTTRYQEKRSVVTDICKTHGGIT
jgi:hypothetical protein